MLSACRFVLSPDQHFADRSTESGGFPINTRYALTKRHRAVKLWRYTRAWPGQVVTDWLAQAALSCGLAPQRLCRQTEGLLNLLSKLLIVGRISCRHCLPTDRRSAGNHGQGPAVLAMPGQQGQWCQGRDQGVSGNRVGG
jgi:hypothetical protein